MSDDFICIKVSSNNISNEIREWNTTNDGIIGESELREWVDSQEIDCDFFVPFCSNQIKPDEACSFFLFSAMIKDRLDDKFEFYRCNPPQSKEDKKYCKAFIKTTNQLITGYTHAFANTMRPKPSWSLYNKVLNSAKSDLISLKKQMYADVYGLGIYLDSSRDELKIDDILYDNVSSPLREGYAIYSINNKSVVSMNGSTDDTVQKIQGDKARLLNSDSTQILLPLTIPNNK